MNFLILWILTILSSYGVMIYTLINLIKYVYDNGYKINTKNNVKEYGDETQDLPINNIFKFSMLIPFYNLCTSFKMMIECSKNEDQFLLELKTFGLIEEMTEFEKQKYAKNPSLKTGLISQNRIEKAMKITIKEELGESVAYVEMNNDDLDIIYSTGPISRLSKEEQKAKVVKFSKEMTKELVDSFIQRLDNFEKDINENKQTNMISNDEAENNLETIRKRKENLIKLKQELIESEANKEIIEEPKTKSMK